VTRPAEEFGADVAIDTSDPNWPDAVLAATSGTGVNLIVDQVAGGVANGNLKAAVVLGRIVNVGRLDGQTGEFDFELHALKRIDYIGVTFRNRTLEAGLSRDWGGSHRLVNERRELKTGSPAKPAPIHDSQVDNGPRDHSAFASIPQSLDSPPRSSSSSLPMPGFSLPTSA
jgi:hypothetical protein